MAKNVIKDNPHAGPGRDAMDQADAYGGRFARLDLSFDDGDTMKIPPFPWHRVFDTAEQLAEWDAYHAEIDETYDRERSVFVPEQKVRDADGNDTGVTLPADEIPGALVQPYRRDGKLVTPAHEVRVVQIALGAAKYERLISKTIDGEPASYADVFRVWEEAAERLRNRLGVDPK